MSILTITSEDARLRWRETIDAAYAGKKSVIIERYSKPVAVLISYEQWQETMRRLKEFELAKLTHQHDEEMKPNPSLIVTEEQYQQAAQAQKLTA